MKIRPLLVEIYPKTLKKELAQGLVWGGGEGRLLERGVYRVLFYGKLIFKCAIFSRPVSSALLAHESCLCVCLFCLDSSYSLVNKHSGKYF